MIVGHLAVVGDGDLVDVTSGERCPHAVDGKLLEGEINERGSTIAEHHLVDAQQGFTAGSMGASDEM